VFEWEEGGRGKGEQDVDRGRGKGEGKEVTEDLDGAGVHGAVGSGGVQEKAGCLRQPLAYVRQRASRIHFKHVCICRCNRSIRSTGYKK